MVLLSLSMIVKNEEQTLARVLACAQQCCDELVVVDTGSTDNTVAIAESFGARVFHFEWINDFAAARNVSLSHCTGEWVMWLDADDYLNPDAIQLINELKQTKMSDPGIDVMFGTYVFHVDACGRPLSSTTRERIFRRLPTLAWDGPVHEIVRVHDGVHNTLLVPQLEVIHDPQKPKDPDRYMALIESHLQPLDEVDISQLNTFLDIRYYYYFAMELLKRHRYAEAMEYFQICLHMKDAPHERFAILVQLARCCINTGQYEAAMEWALAAIRLDSSRAEGFAMMGESYFNQDKFAKAIPFFHAAINSFMPQAAYIQRPEYGNRSYHFLACCYNKLGDPEKTAQFLFQAMKDGADLDVLLPQFRHLIESNAMILQPKPTQIFRNASNS